MKKKIKDRVESLISLAFTNQYIKNKMFALSIYDAYTFKHSINVASESLCIGIQMGLDKTKLLELAYASLLHDIGKMNITKKIINKTGKLTNEEFEIIKTHPRCGAKEIEDTRLFSIDVINGVLMHHENTDGSGYYGFKGNDICLYAQIIRIADAFDAMTDKRPYHEAMNCNEALKRIDNLKNSSFDSDIVDILHYLSESDEVGKNMLSVSNYC